MEAVVEIDEDDNAEPPPKKIPVPAKLNDISGAHNPHWYQFIQLFPKPEYESLARHGNEHAGGAFCHRCSAKVFFKKGRSHVKRHLERYHRRYLLDFEKRKKLRK
ncbi:hypothetical protein PC120_g26882 [Phytophthora cactorum]|nr:hypothetical protein PC120_g26882 [Phytophthora cactorum]